MGNPQTSINIAGQPVAYAGLATHVEDSKSAINGEASASMPLGIGVMVGTNPISEVKIPASATAIEGITIANANRSNFSDFGGMDSTGVKYGFPVEVLRHGRCWVKVDSTVTSIAANVDRGWCRVTAGSGSGVGSGATVGTWQPAVDPNTAGNTLDCTRSVLFVSKLMTAADGTYIAEAMCNFGIKI